MPLAQASASSLSDRQGEHPLAAGTGEGRAVCSQLYCPRTNPELSSPFSLCPPSFPGDTGSGDFIWNMPKGRGDPSMKQHTPSPWDTTQEHTASPEPASVPSLSPCPSTHSAAPARCPCPWLTRARCRWRLCRR